MPVFFREQYLLHAKPRKRSYDRDEEMFRLRIEPEFGSMRMNQVTRKQVRLFHTGLLKERLPHLAINTAPVLAVTCMHPEGYHVFYHTYYFVASPALVL